MGGNGEDTDVLAATKAAPATIPDPVSGLEQTVAPPPSGIAGTAVLPVGSGVAGVSGLEATVAPGGRIAGGDQLPIVDPSNYERLEEFARGGLGRILRAKDRRTGRIVAIKEMLGDADELAVRFAREARVTANLQHPAIVPVYELGRWPSGEPFYAMKLVAGQSLQEVIAATRTLADRLARLADVAAVADALAYAHGQHVIHRDLKPANVLVGEFGETVVIDWGLAKVIGETERASSAAIAQGHAGEVTMAGSVLGTPYYMPPEQAVGGDADERADVYAIGAMLYQLITGRAPFADRKPRDVGHLLAMVTSEPPTPIAELEPEAPPDLVTITSKAMARDATARYPSARELADDLRRFVNGQLVHAHRYDRRTLFKRWVRRNRAAVTVAGALLAVLVAGAAVSVRSIIVERDTADTERAAAVVARDDAKQQTQIARESLATALAQKGRLAESEQRWGIAAMYYAAARVQHDTAETRWSAGLAEARAIAAAVRYTGHASAVNAAAISPDATRVATVDHDGMVHLWSRHDGKPIAKRKLAGGLWAVAYSPDGRELAVGGDAGVVYRMTSELAAVSELRGHTQRIWSLAYSPDGDTLASGSEDSTIRLWRVISAHSRVLRGHTQRVYSVAFSADGKRFASGADDRRVLEWDLATTKWSERTSHKGGGIRGVAFTPDSAQLVATGWDYNISLVPNDGSPTVQWGAAHSSHALAITPDQRAIITAGDSGQVQFWDVTTRKLVTSLDVPGGRTNAAAVSRDGRWLVTAGQTRLAVVWDLHAMARVADVVGHAAAITTVTFSPDGTKFVTASDDHTTRIWDTATATERLRLAMGALWCNETAVFTADAREIVTTCDDDSVRRYDLTGQLIARYPMPLNLKFASISPHTTTLTGGHMRGVVAQLDLATGARLGERKLHDHQIYIVRHAPDGKIVTAGLDNKVKVWTAKLEPLHVFTADTIDGVLAADISADSTLVAAGSQDGMLDAWRLASDQRVAQIAAHQATIWELVISRDNRHVFTGAEDGVVKMWDATTWKLVAALDAHEGPIYALAISPDGKTLVSGHRSGGIVVWDVATRTARHRIGGGARDHGACDKITQQKWVDREHERIVSAACASDAQDYFGRFSRGSHQRIENNVNVVPDWPATPSP